MCGRPCRPRARPPPFAAVIHDALTRRELVACNRRRARSGVVVGLRHPRRPLLRPKRTLLHVRAGGNHITDARARDEQSWHCHRRRRARRPSIDHSTRGASDGRGIANPARAFSYAWPRHNVRRLLPPLCARRCDLRRRAVSAAESVPGAGGGARSCIRSRHGCLAHRRVSLLLVKSSICCGAANLRPRVGEFTPDALAHRPTDPLGTSCPINIQMRTRVHGSAPYRQSSQRITSAQVRAAPRSDTPHRLRS